MCVRRLYPPQPVTPPTYSFRSLIVPGMSLSKLYLLAYNGALCSGWAAILVQIIRQLIASNGDFSSVYPTIRTLLIMSQSAAVMEILHAMTGLVRSPVGTTFIQVLSRIIVLYGALEVGSKKVTENYFATQMIVAWALSEIIRYSFYFVGLIDKEKVPKIMTVARYTGFMILYPLGITGEMACMYNALDHVKATGIYSLAMPNSYNFAFNYHGFIWFTLLAIYPPGSYVMYNYMLGQRRKVLGGASKKAKKD